MQLFGPPFKRFKFSTNDHERCTNKTTQKLTTIRPVFAHCTARDRGTRGRRKPTFGQTKATKGRRPLQSDTIRPLMTTMIGAFRTDAWQVFSLMVPLGPGTCRSSANRSKSDVAMSQKALGKLIKITLYYID